MVYFSETDSLSFISWHWHWVTDFGRGVCVGGALGVVVVGEERFHLFNSNSSSPLIVFDSSSQLYPDWHEPWHFPVILPDPSQGLPTDWGFMLGREKERSLSKFIISCMNCGSFVVRFWRDNSISSWDLTHVFPASSGWVFFSSLSLSLSDSDLYTPHQLSRPHEVQN